MNNLGAMETVRVGVVGAGRLGRFHAKLLAAMQGVKLVGVVDAIPSAADALAEEIGCRAYMDPQELAPHIDAAVIASPTKYHHQVSMPLLKLGKHLLIEKPIAIDVGEAAELVLSAAHHRAIVQVGHIERFSPAFVNAAAALGAPEFISAERHSGYTFRSTDIGVVHDLMIHDIDLVLSLTQSAVRKVDSWGARVFGPHEDTASARVEFANGMVAEFSASRVCPEPSRKMQAWSRDKYIQIDYATRKYSMLRMGERLRAGFDAENLSAKEKQANQERVFQDWLPMETFSCAESNPLQDELNDFVHCIRTGETPRVDGRQALSAMRLADQILTSMRLIDWGGDDRLDSHHSVIRPPHWDASGFRKRSAG